MSAHTLIATSHGTESLSGVKTETGSSNVHTTVARAWNLDIATGEWSKSTGFFAMYRYYQSLPLKVLSIRWRSATATASMYGLVLLTCLVPILELIGIWMTNSVLWTDTLENATIVPPQLFPAAHVVIGWTVYDTNSTAALVFTVHVVENGTSTGKSVRICGVLDGQDVVEHSTQRVVELVTAVSHVTSFAL